MIITIDGPSGTGKTTVAKEVARRLGYDYFDSGALYRLVTYGVLKHHIDMDKKEALASFLAAFVFHMEEQSDGRHYFFEGEDSTQIIRSPNVTAYVSAVAAKHEVRAALMRFQREFAKNHHAVFEGRDMGTTVFPGADVKFFLTASAEERARRRHGEWRGTNEKEVLQQLAQRDHADSTREHSPLRQADDAHLIDTSKLSIEEVVNTILGFLK